MDNINAKSSGAATTSTAVNENEDKDALFKAEQKVFDDATPVEYAAVLKELEEAAARFKETIPDFVCHLNRENDQTAVFAYKETSTTLRLIKDHLDERGRDNALRVTLPNGQEHNYRPYKHEEGLVWICDDQKGEVLVGTSKDFAAKLIEVCSRG